MSFKVTSIRLEDTVDGNELVVTLNRIKGDPQRVVADVFNLTDPLAGQGQGLCIDPTNIGHRHMMTDHLLRLFDCDRKGMAEADMMDLVEYVCK